jgi:HEAT repeat protein
MLVANVNNTTTDAAYWIGNMINLHLTNGQKQIVSQWLKVQNGIKNANGATFNEITVTITLESEPAIQLYELSHAIEFKNDWLWDADPDLRTEAIKKICSCGQDELLSRSFLQSLAYQMLSKQPAIRKAAIDCLLTQIPLCDNLEEIILPVVDRIILADLEIKQDVIRALPNLRSSTVTKQLIRFLATRNEEMRSLATEVLHDIVLDQLDFEEIAALLYNEDPGVRFDAAEFLYAEGQESLIPACILNEN